MSRYLARFAVLTPLVAFTIVAHASVLVRPTVAERRHHGRSAPESIIAAGSP